MRQRMVIKLGGSSLQNPGVLQELAALIQGYQKRRYDVVVVHGGGPAINQALTERGIEWKFINGQRQTTPEMMGVIEEVLAKNVNSMLVDGLASCGIRAGGLSGAQDRILFCAQADPALMQVGQVQFVDTTAIEERFSTIPRTVPVIAPIGLGSANEKYNINADVAAAQIAIALNARKLIFLTDQDGVLDQDRRVIRKLTTRMIDLLIEDGVISGGMFAKTKAMLAALNGGVRKVRVLNANHAGQILTDKTAGTLLTQVSNTNTQKDVMHGFAS